MFYYIYKSEGEDEDSFCCFKEFGDTFVQSSKRGRFRELDRACSISSHVDATKVCPTLRSSKT
ncbi:hypothetical protein BDC45DRAFT_216096 [Circinella umbellata]|nr:hypothetical protein BDC45DRAFT_216096 [Circinella umbellata]